MGCVRADMYNLILIFASYYYAPWPCTRIYIEDMRTKKVIECAVTSERIGFS